MKEISHSKPITVDESHLDYNRHVNNVQFVKWMEEIATEHWENLKHQSPYAEYAWVLVDHHIQYKKQVFLNEILTVKTYPQQPEGLRQPRKVEFYRNGELVVDSRTLWVLYDANANRVVKIAPDWLKCFDK